MGWRVPRARERDRQGDIDSAHPGSMYVHERLGDGRISLGPGLGRTARNKGRPFNHQEEEGDDAASVEVGARARRYVQETRRSVSQAGEC